MGPLYLEIASDYGDSRKNSCIFYVKGACSSLRNAWLDSGYVLCVSTWVLLDVFGSRVTPRAVFLSIVGRLGVSRSAHSRCFSCGICPEPLVSDSQPPAVRALPEWSFLSPRWLTPASCRGLRGDGDAGSSLRGVLSPELSACIGAYGETHTSYTSSASTSPPHPLPHPPSLSTSLFHNAPRGSN